MLTALLRPLLPASFMFSLLAATPRLPAQEPLQLYVSPGGSDEGAGVGWSSKRPYRTLDRAALAVRRLVGDGRGKVGIVVTMMPGVYRLDAPLVLGSKHSGSESGPVVLRAQAKGTVTVCGSVQAGPWTPWRDGIYTAPFPEGVDRIDTVYAAAGERLPAARTPNVDPEHPRTGGMLYVLAAVDEQPKTALVFDPRRLDVSRWKDWSQARLVIWPDRNWNCDRVPITGVEPEDNLLTFKPVRYGLRRGNRFFIEHVLSELDAPGEWYADAKSRTLYLKPPTGASPDEITVPKTSELVVLADEGSAPVSHIRIEGIRFTECSGTALVLANAQHCTVTVCEITRTGDAGIVLRNMSSDNRIAGCDVAWTGTEGIRLEGVRDTDRTRETAMARNIIENNHVHHVGMNRNAGGAIDLRPYCGGNITHDNVFRRNLLHDTPRKGIMMGGVHNIAEGNHIHHTNLEQSDTGAIGLCTRDVHERGCIIRHNLVHDVGGYNMLEPGVWAFPSYSWAVYLDDWSSGTTVDGNILLDAPRGGVHIHGGLDNVIENNIIRGGDKWQLEVNPMGSREFGGKTYTMTGNRILRNIALGRADAAWLKGRGAWMEGLAECDRNLLWFDGAEPFCLDKRGDPIPWKDWQKAGFDTNSRVAKPEFTATDWQLRPDFEPAAELGIKPLPVEQIGLYASPERFSWPVRTEWTRETPVLRCTVPIPTSKRKQRAIQPRSGEVKIDGTLGSDEWKKATPLVLERNHRDEPAQPRSLGFAFYDAQGLYVGIDNVVDPNEPLQTGNAWGKDDAVEIAVRPQDTPDAPILVLRGFVNGILSGAADGGMSEGAAADVAERCRYAAAVVSPLRWTAEIFIPWNAISADAPKPTALQFNLTCRKTAGNLFICWKPTGRHSYGVGNEGVLVPADETGK